MQKGRRTPGEQDRRARRRQAEGSSKLQAIGQCHQPRRTGAGIGELAVSLQRPGGGLCDLRQRRNGGTDGLERSGLRLKQARQDLSSRQGVQALGCRVSGFGAAHDHLIPPLVMLMPN